MSSERSLHHPDGPDPDRDNWHRHDGEPRYPELMECEGQTSIFDELEGGE